MKPERRFLMVKTKGFLTAAVFLCGVLSLSGCVTNKVLELRRDRETRVNAATNFWSLAAVRSGYVISGGDAFACVEFRDSPRDTPQAYTINLSRTSLIGRTFLETMPTVNDRTETENAPATPRSPIWYFYPLQEAQKGCRRSAGDGPSQISELEVETIHIPREDQAHISKILLSHGTASAGESRLIAVDLDLEGQPSEDSDVKETLLVYLSPDGNPELVGPVGVAGAFESSREWINPYTLLVAPAVAADTLVVFLILSARGDPSRYIDQR